MCWVCDILDRPAVALFFSRLDKPVEYTKYELLFLAAQNAYRDLATDRIREAGRIREAVKAGGDVIQEFCVALELDIREIPPTGETKDAFDVKVGKMLSEAVGGAFNVPELRSVAVVFDWVGDLNQGAATYLWYDKAGTINPGNREAICGSIGQTAKLLSFQTLLAVKLSELIDTTVEQRLAILSELQEKVDEQANKATDDGSEGESHQDDLGSAPVPGD